MKSLPATALAICIFCILLSLAFTPLWLQHKVLAPLDIVQTLMQPWRSAADPSKTIDVHNHFVTDATSQFLVYQHIAHVSLRQDGYIGWNPLIFAGTPESANTISTYFDWTMQLHRFLGFWEAWHLGFFLQFAIAGIGMLLFLRSQALSPPACLAGAIAYAGNAQFLLLIYYRSALGSFCWVPWMLWALEFCRQGPLTRVIPFVLFTTLAFLGGSIQYTAFILLLLLCVILGWRKPLFKGAGRIIAATAMAAALAAVMFVPCVQAFLDNSAVGHHRGALGYKEGWLAPVLHPAVTLCSMFPSALGSVRTLDLAKVFKGDIFDLVYFGFLPVLLAFYCLVANKAPRAARYLMLAGLILPLTPLEGVLYHRVSLLFIVGGVWAFAEFWDRLDGKSARTLGTKSLVVFGAVTLLWLAGSVFLVTHHAQMVNLLKSRVAGSMATAHFGMFRQWMLDRVERFVSDLPIWSRAQILPWALAGLSLLLLRFRRSMPGHLASYSLCGILAIQAGMFASDWVTLSDRPALGVLPDNAEIAALKTLVGNERTFLVTKLGNPPLFPPNTLAAYDIATLQGYESIWPRTMWHKTGYGVTPDILSRLGVTFAIVQKDAASPVCWQPHAPEDDGKRNVFWNRAPLEALVSGSAPYRTDGVPPAQDSGSCWPLVYSGAAFDVFKNKQEAARYRAADVRGGPAGPVEVLRETYNRRELSVPEGAGSVRVAENWSPGWRYRVGQSDWRPALQASDMSMTLPLTALQSPITVEMEYRPADWGRWISLAACLGILGLLAVGLSGADFSLRGTSVPPAEACEAVRLKSDSKDGLVIS